MSDKLIDEMNTMFEMLETLTFDADLKALVANIGNKVETTIQSYSPWHEWPKEKPTEEGLYIVLRWVEDGWLPYHLPSLSDALIFLEYNVPKHQLWQFISLPDPPKE